MRYTLEECHPGVMLVSIKGRITVEHGDGVFVEAINAALASRPDHLIVDFAEVSMIDSCGIGELVAAYLRARRAGCRLGVVRPNARVLEILRVTRLDSILIEPAPLVNAVAAVV